MEVLVFTGIILAALAVSVVLGLGLSLLFSVLFDFVAIRRQQRSRVG